MKTDTGGAAFPTEVLYPPEGRDGEDGMSLLDHFAGQAILGILADPESVPLEPKVYAEEAYKQAQAMISEKRRLEQ